MKRGRVVADIENVEEVDDEQVRQDVTARNLTPVEEFKTVKKAESDRKPNKIYKDESISKIDATRTNMNVNITANSNVMSNDEEMKHL
jgi:hypothetical protein